MQEYEEISQLIAQLRNSADDVLRNTIEKLVQIGKDAVPALIPLLQDQDGDVRALAADALEKIGTPEALEAVKEYESRQ